MSLESSPNEILLQVLRDLDHPGAWDDLAAYSLADETFYPPHSYQTPGWKPSRCVSYTEFNRSCQYWAALRKADLVIQGISASSHHMREVSWDILVLRAKGTSLLSSTTQASAGCLTWKLVSRAVDEREEFYGRLLEPIFEDEEEEMRKRARGELWWGFLRDPRITGWLTSGRKMTRKETMASISSLNHRFR